MAPDKIADNRLRLREEAAAGWYAPWQDPEIIRKSTERERKSRLISQLKSGGHRAFDEIFLKYSKRVVFGQALRVVGKETDAEDVVQEVFLAVYKKIRTFREQSQFKTWLYRVTTNMALLKLRTDKRRREVPLYDCIERFPKDRPHRATRVVDRFNEADNPSTRYELQQLLRTSLNELGPQDRRIVLMSDLEGFADREIAQMLNISLPAVKSRLHRARRLLRRELAV
jgi:RNA polymerase sigma-70 factor, ECF subfamily